jgi:predicted ArsR family transcriptional regulator
MNDPIRALQSVRIHLLDQSKPVSAASIGAALGMEHEEVYAHLIRLDTLGQARAGVWVPGVQSGHRYGWEAT